MDLSVVIISTNEARFLAPCLTALRNGLTGLQAEVFLVNNQCDDDSEAVAQAAYPDIKIVRNEVRCGFARSNNRALRQAQGRYLLVLNPDTEVRPDALPTLVKYLDARPKVAMAGAKLLNPDGTIQYSCRKFPNLRAIFFRWTPFCPRSLRDRALWKYLMLDWDHAQARPVDWIMGACMCVRRAASDQVGLLDEGFFLYHEDIDWCYRMWQQGWEVHYVPAAVVLHHHQQSSVKRPFSRSTRIHIRSAIRLFLKHRWLRI